MIKKYSLILLLCCLSYAANAQDRPYQLGIGAGFNGGYILSWASMNSFFDTYSKQVTGLSAPVKPFGLETGYKIALNCNGKKWVYELSVNRMYAHTHAEIPYEYGVQQRHFTLRSNLWYLDAGRYLHHTGHSYSALLFGVQFGNNQLHSSWIYPDGTESYAAEKDLNGVYTNYATKIYAGFRTEAALTKKLWLFLNITYAFPFNIFPFYMEDLSPAKGDPNDIRGFQWLPQNYDANKAPYEYDYSDKKVNDNYFDLRLSVGLHYVLVKAKED
jgi:hypothetical protein